MMLAQSKGSQIEEWRQKGRDALEHCLGAASAEWHRQWMARGNSCCADGLPMSEGWYLYGLAGGGADKKYDFPCDTCGRRIMCGYRDEKRKYICYQCSDVVRLSA